MTRRYSAVALTATALLMALIWAGSAAAYAPQLMRYPYLTDVVGTSATVNWGTDRSRSTGRSASALASSSAAVSSGSGTAIIEERLVIKVLIVS